MSDETTENVRPFDQHDAESRLREVLIWARAEAVEFRASDPAKGRAAALLATKVEDALRVVLIPVP